MAQRPGELDAVICDIDGCLCSETTAGFDLEALGRVAAWNQLARQQLDRPPVTLCTGRPQPFAESMARLIGCHLPCVCENGVWLYDPVANVYELDEAIRIEHRDTIREATAWVERELGPRGVTIQPGKSASISLYHADLHMLTSLVPMLERAFAACGWPLRVSMTWYYINCDLAHISKGTGLDRLIAQQGWKRSRLAGIGDTTSDAAIADRVGWFACPANAHEAITPRAAYVSPHDEARGVVDILAQLANR